MTTQPDIPLFFARPNVTYPGGAPAHLVEAGAVSLPSDGDTGLTEFLLGQSFFPEAFATRAARDARLGPVHENICFVPASWAEAKAGGFTLADAAIGPGLGENGFEAVADAVLPSKIERLKELAGDGEGWMDVSVIIARVEYIVRLDAAGTVTVMAAPLYRAWNGEPEIDATMAWLEQAVSKWLATATTPASC